MYFILHLFTDLYQRVPLAVCVGMSIKVYHLERSLQSHDIIIQASLRHYKLNICNNFIKVIKNSLKNA